ncbi:glycerophosphodiester phosphodiesterase family protein [Rufibacter glacialis]|uniref:Glycerophosphodiester phosphodiesterase n=1 Tax=Rufibacter glacialis TaxID=1259555 RepID=A0A5M8QGY9_9BACT|nr:glycerophosphodiester phosphodiesterase family protein [Rufibacter glacialis]KAA6435347.1 glycerophosphodiester phosphodiesterase [Rufibacter glacialis]GGK62572.1 glycerophosphoryl diester phosphodiesterase [Rufibacter glacialis]
MKKTVSALLFSAALVVGCKSAQSLTQQLPPLPAFGTEGHRGARGLMPENSIPAMRKAIDLGVTTLEMDCHVTRDGQVVVTHDPHINPLYARTPDGKDIPTEDAKKHIVYQMDYAQVKAFELGTKRYSAYPEQQLVKTYIPRLADLIDSVQTYLKTTGKPQVFYNIEVKSKVAGDNKLHPASEEFVKAMMQVIEKKGIAPYVVIQSFDVRPLQVLHKKYPHVRTSFLVDNKKTVAENLTELGFTPVIYSPAHKMVTAELVKACHDRGIKVIPWTVNTAELMTKLKALGVDGIISDYPNLFAQQ